MARTSITIPTRTHRVWVLSLAIGTATLVVAALAAWALLVRSSGNPTRSAPVATSPSPASQGPRTDVIPVDPGALNEPMLVVESYLESLNRGDTAGALAVLAPDTVYIGPRCRPACIDTTAIGPSLENPTASNGQLSLTDPRVEGDTLTAHFNLASPKFPASVRRVVGTTTAIVRNHKIILLSMDWDPTDSQTKTVLYPAIQH